MWIRISLMAFSCLSTDTQEKEETKEKGEIPEGSILSEVQTDGKIKFQKYLQGDWRDL